MEGDPRRPEGYTIDPISYFLSANGKSILTLAGGAAAGAYLRFFFEQWSAKKQARRDMIASVTKSVEDLAKQYYWNLANNASTLAFIFDDYLDRRIRIQLLQDPPPALNRQLEQLIDKAVEDSFSYYARFTILTYRFETRAGSTFLLRDFWAGKSIRNLQNALKQIVPLDTELVDLVDAPDGNGKLQETTPAAFLTNEEFEASRLRYRKLFHNEEKVRLAAKYLRACADLFNYELAELYRDWYQTSWGKVILDMPANSSELRQSVPLASVDTINEVNRRFKAVGYAIAPLTIPPPRKSVMDNTTAKPEGPATTASTPGDAPASVKHDGTKATRGTTPPSDLNEQSDEALVNEGASETTPQQISEPRR